MTAPDDCVDEDRVVRLENQVDALQAKLKQTLDTLEAAETRARNAEKQVAALEDEVATLQDQTDLLGRVRKASALKPAERAAVLVQTLHADAIANGQKPNHDARAKMDYRDANSALGGGWLDKRDRLYAAMRKATTLVDDSQVLTFVESTDENYHLRLDLEAGQLPATVAGYDVTVEAD